MTFTFTGDVVTNTFHCNLRFRSLVRSRVAWTNQSERPSAEIADDRHTKNTKNTKNTSNSICSSDVYTMNGDKHLLCRFVLICASVWWWFVLCVSTTFVKCNETSIELMASDYNRLGLCAYTSTIECIRPNSRFVLRSNISLLARRAAGMGVPCVSVCVWE